MHMETSQKWNENPKEAIRPRGLYTVLTKGDTFVVKYQDIGSGLWASRGNKLWEGKYMGELVEDKGWTYESTIVSDD